MNKKHLILLLCVVLIIIIPFGLNVKDKGGTDDIASSELEKSGYTPWFESMLKPQSEEMENLLFGAQAAIGLIIIAFFLRYYRKKQNS